MPKRKLRLWYNKNDYLKERENEKKLSESNQNDNVEEPISKSEMTEPTGIDNDIAPVNSNEASKIEDKIEVLPAETNINIQQTEAQKTEIPPDLVNAKEQASDKENNVEINPNNEINETKNMIGQTVQENDSKLEPLEPIQKETLETHQIESIENPIYPQQKEALIELKWVKDQDKLADPLTRPNAELVEAAVESTEEIAPVEILKEQVPADIENKLPLIDSVVNIEKYTNSLKYLLPTKAVVCIGEYAINIVLKGSFEDKKDSGVLPIFVEKSTQDVIKWSQGKLDKNNIVCLDEDIDTHFWYDILPYVADNDDFFAKVKSKPIEKLQGAIMISSSWNGVGSALLPSLNAQFKEWNINSIAIPLLPSKGQPLDGQFNSFASIGILASKGATLLLLDRSNLENYTGIDRNGFVIDGNTVVNYLLDLMLTKENFAQELCELSNSFDTKMFTAYLASGVSLKIYNSIENMLDTTLLRPLFNFDLSSATLLYVLIRMPFHLKEKLPTEKIESAISDWFKDKANLESIYIADPVYVEDSGDRIDIALVVGGFETATRFAAVEKRVTKMKNQAVKKGLITEEDWQAITKSLLS